MKKDKVEQAASNESIYVATVETYFEMCQEDPNCFPTLSLDDQQAAVVVEIEKEQGALPDWKKEVVRQGVKRYKRFEIKR